MKLTPSQLLRDAADHHLWDGVSHKKGTVGPLCLALAMTRQEQDALKGAGYLLSREVCQPLRATNESLLSSLPYMRSLNPKQTQSIRYMWAHLLANVMEDGR